MSDEHPHERTDPFPTEDGFCIAPWVHLHVTQSGNVTPCCRINAPLSNVNREGIREIWDGRAMRDLRLKFLSGERIPLCKACHDHEDVGAESYRKWLNRRFAAYVPLALDSGTDGAAGNARPVYWDIRFSNICNFRCRTCWHGASSRWYGDSQRLGIAIADQPVIQNIENSSAFLDSLEEFAPNVEEIVFAGGEPLLTDEHFRILEALLTRGLTDLKIRCVTNLSELRYKQTEITDLWNKFSNVEVRASLDGIGKRGEMIRKELSWPRFVDNIRRVRSEAPHVDLYIDMTVSVLNLFHVPDTQTNLLERGLIDFGKLELRALHDPAYYNIKLFPAAMKRDATQLLQEHADWVYRFGARIGADHKICAEERARVASLIDFMWADNLAEHIVAFSNMTTKLDRIREEACADLCPELRPLIEHPYQSSLLGTARHLRQRAMLAVKRLAKVRI